MCIDITRVCNDGVYWKRYIHTFHLSYEIYYMRWAQHIIDLVLWISQYKSIDYYAFQMHLYVTFNGICPFGWNKLCFDCGGFCIDDMYWNYILLERYFFKKAHREWNYLGQEKNKLLWWVKNNCFIPKMLSCDCSCMARVRYNVWSYVNTNQINILYWVIYEWWIGWRYSHWVLLTSSRLR